jgi:uracil-DNA glycosylase family 4
MIRVPPRGNPQAKIMLVGEAPGGVEEQQLKPFVGPAGNVLTEMLMKAGIDPAECYYTNLSKYRPPGNDLSAWGKYGIPNETLSAGIDDLISEVEAVNPNVILPLGNWPLHFFYGLKLNDKGLPTGISDYRGYVLEARKICKGRKILPTFHPSFYLHGNFGEAGLGLFDLRKAMGESKRSDIVRVPRHYFLDPRGAERDLLRARLLAEGPILFFDIEYIGNSLKCVGFSCHPSWAMTVKIRGEDDVHWCKDLLESGAPLGAQNAMYDVGMLEWHYGIHCFQHLVYDTMVAAYALNIEHKKDLGFLGSLYTDMAAWWDVVDWDKIRDGRQSVDELLPYNCGDNVVTCEVAQKQQPELDSDSKFREAFKFDMAKLPALWAISKRGVPLNVAKVEEVKTLARRTAKEAQETLNDVVDALGMDRKGVDFNVKSPLAVPELLAAWLNIELTKRTEKGRYWDTSNVQLMEYMRKSKDSVVRSTIAKMIEIRESRDIESKFVGIEWDKDLRARCIYDATKTVTRRLSSKTFFPTGKGTNMQNLPAPNSSVKYGGLVRSCFTTDPGWKFGYADLKGAEFFIVAEVTQDAKMLEFAEMTLKGTGKVHAITASYIFGGDPKLIGKDSPEYFLGKKMRHSGNYMVGWKELMGRINAEALETGVWVDAATTKRLIDGYIGLHPGLPTWWDEVRFEGKSTGRLRNLFGFIRVINDRVDNCLPELVAFKPQSTVGDALNFGLLACENDQQLRELGFEIFLQVHDAIGFQYNPRYETEILSRVEKLLSIPIYIPKTGRYLTIPIEIATGNAWFPLEEWRRA